MVESVALFRFSIEMAVCHTYNQDAGGQLPISISQSVSAFPFRKLRYDSVVFLLSIITIRNGFINDGLITYDLF